MSRRTVVPSDPWSRPPAPARLRPVASLRNPDRQLALCGQPVGKADEKLLVHMLRQHNRALEFFGQSGQQRDHRRRAAGGGADRQQTGAVAGIIASAWPGCCVPPRTAAAIDQAADVEIFRSRSSLPVPWPSAPITGVLRASSAPAPMASNTLAPLPCTVAVMTRMAQGDWS